jgi:hypothetical protein
MCSSSVLFGDDVSCELWHEELIVKSVSMKFGVDLCCYSEISDDVKSRLLIQKFFAIYTLTCRWHVRGE